MEITWKRNSLLLQQFTRIFRSPLECYASLLQELPTSETRHYTCAHSMLDHAIETVACALKLRQTRLLSVGAALEDQIA